MTPEKWQGGLESEHGAPPILQTAEVCSAVFSSNPVDRAHALAVIASSFPATCVGARAALEVLCADPEPCLRAWSRALLTQLDTEPEATSTEGFQLPPD